MKKTDLAYVAGIIDGEGCIHIANCGSNKYKYGRVFRLGISLASTDEWLPNWLKFAFGGYVYSKPIRPPSKKSQWEWRLGDVKAMDFLRLIYPYLKLKKPQAEVAINFQRSRRRGGYKTTEEMRVQEAQSIVLKGMK